MAATAPAPTSASSAATQPFSARVDRAGLGRIMNLARRAGISGSWWAAQALLEVAGNTLKVTITDGATTLVGHTSCWPTDNRTAGAGYVPRRRFHDDLRALPDGALSIEVDEGHLYLYVGGASVVRRRDVAVDDDMPTVPRPSGTPVTVPPSDLDLLRTVTVAASTDEARPVLTAVALDGTQAAATDSYRLILARLDTELPALLVPAQSVALVAREARDADVEVTADDKHVRFAWSRHDVEWELTVRTIEGTYPDVNVLVPDRPADTVTVDRGALLAVVRRHARFLKDGRWGPQHIQMVRSDAGTLTATSGGELDGSLVEPTSVPWPGDVALSGRFAAELLAAVPDVELALSIRTELKPVVFYGDRLTVLQMPMRVQ